MRDLELNEGPLARYATRWTPTDLDTDARLRGHQIVYASAVCVPIVLVFALVDLVFFSSLASFSAYVGFGLAVGVGVPRVLRVSRSTDLTTHLLLACAAVLLLCLSWLRGGFPWSNLVWLLAGPGAAASVLSERRQALPWVLMALVSVGVFYALDLTGAGPTPRIVMTEDQDIVAGVFSLIGLLAMFLFIVRPAVDHGNRLIRERDLLERRLHQVDRLESLGRLASEVAHDFGNVLGAIMTTASDMRRRLPETDPRLADVKLVCNAADRGRDMIRQLMSFAGAGYSPTEPVELNERVSGLQPLLARVLGNKIRLRVELRPGPTTVAVDPNQFDRALMNLATNARDAMPDGGTFLLSIGGVRVEAGDRPGLAPLEPGVYMSIEVSDNGCGMSDDVAERIFEPYFTTKGESGGTGLGLAITYRAIREAKGDISVETAPGRGTRFRILLPAHTPAVASDVKPAADRAGID